MAKPSKFAHVVYSTRRYEEMVDWYQKVFEATVAYQNPAFVFLTYDDEHHRFAFANLSLLSPPDAAETRGKEASTMSLTPTRIWVIFWRLTNGSKRWASILTGASIWQSHGVPG